MARSFDSTADKITFGSVPLPATTGSLGYWFYPNWAKTDGVAHAMFEQSSEVSLEFSFQMIKWSDNNLYLGWFQRGGTDYRVIISSANYTLNQNAWNLFVLTWDDAANQSKAYLNGAQIGSTTSSLVTATLAGLRTIGNVVTPTYNLNGRMAEFAIWDAVLTLDEVAALGKRFSPLLIRPTALLNYLPLVRDLSDWIGATSVVDTSTAVIEHPPVYYPRPVLPLTPPLSLSYNQEGFRWRNDDGDEDAATWLAAQDTNITRDRELNTRVRILTDVSSDPPSEGTKLQYRKVGDPDWLDVQ